MHSNDRICIKRKGISNALSILEYQLSTQKEKTASFEVDCDKYIELFKQAAEKFKQWIEMGKFENDGMMEMFQEHNKFISSEYGKCLL